MWPIIIDFCGYAVLLLCLAVWARRRTSTLASYVLGGRHFNGWVTGLAAGAADMSTWLFMALPGTVYQHGLCILWLVGALILGAYCNWHFLARRLRLYTEICGNTLSLTSFLVRRFHAHQFWLRLLTGLIVLVFFSIYASAGLVSGARLLGWLFSCSYGSALLILVVIIVSYTAVGGFLAVNWIDFLQGIFIFIALIVLPVVAAKAVTLGTALPYLLQQLPGHFTWFGGLAWWKIAAFLSWGLGYFGQLHISTRFIAIDSVASLPLARRLCMGWMVIALLGAVATGMLGRIYYPANLAHDADTIFLVLAKQLFNPWITGLLIAAVLSVVLSSVSAMLLVIANIFLEDLCARWLSVKKTAKTGVKYGYIASLGASIIPAFLAFYSKLSIFNLVGLAWSGLGASFGPALLLAVFWPRMTALGALAGMLTGMFSVLLFAGLCNYAPGSGLELFPSFVASMLAIYVVSAFFSKPKTLALQEFALLKTKC
jgi:sodium/proline symporter